MDAVEWLLPDERVTMNSVFIAMSQEVTRVDRTDDQRVDTTARAGLSGNSGLATKARQDHSPTVDNEGIQTNRAVIGRRYLGVVCHIHSRPAERATVGR